MLIISETTLRIIILSFVTIASSSTPMSGSRPQSRGYLGNGLTSPTSKIETNRRVKAMPQTIEAPPAALRIDRSARRIFFWPWKPRWYHHRWWHRRPFGFGAGIGIGIGPGAGLAHHRPVRLPGFGGNPGIGVGLEAGIGGIYRPGVEIGAGAGVAFGTGIVPSPSIYDHYEPQASVTISDDNNGNNVAHNDAERQPINYPDLPPVPNDYNDRQPISSNAADLSAPSAVGFDDGAEHTVGYDRTGRNSIRYKSDDYLKADPGRYNSHVNYEIDRGSTQHNGSYMTIDDIGIRKYLH